MKRRIFSVSILLVATLVMVFAKQATPPAELPEYYKSLNGKSASGLFDAVHSVTLVGFKSLGYDGARDAYQTTDVYPADSVGKAGKLWDMYGACGFTSGDECGNYNSECDCYNREHSIPKSWWGGGKNETYSDIFHLVPTDGYVNNRRGNYAFGEVDGTPTYSYKGAKLGSPKTLAAANTIAGNLSVKPDVSPVFEPIDQYKGDFARGYMGTLLHYTSLNMTTGHGGAIFSGSNTAGNLYGLTEYGVALLMKWHRMDPVSQKEIDRNNGIQATQGNRNPFIDYPDLAEYIWGSHAGEVFLLADATATFADDYDPGTGGGGTIEPPVVEPVELKLYRNGDIETIDEWDINDNLPTDEDDACDDDEWLFAGWSASNVSATTDKPDFITKVSKAGYVFAVYANTVVTPGSGTSTPAVVDVLTRDLTGVTGTSYSSWTGKKATSDAVYAGQSAGGNSSIQLRSSNNNSGIVTTASGGKATKVVVEWNSNTSDGRTLNVYGKNSAYSSPSDLYGDNSGTLIGTIVKGTSTELSISADYEYIGMRSSSGAMWLDKITITWGGDGSSSVTTYSSDVECAAACEGKLATPDVTAIPGDKQITLSWADVENADHYEVAISAGVGFTTECEDPTIGAIEHSGSQNTCVISGLVNGLDYTTTVRAIGTSVCDGDADTDITTPTEGVAPSTVTLTFIVAGKPYAFDNIPVGAKMEDIIAGLLAIYPTTYEDEYYIYTFDGFEETLPEYVTEDVTTFTVKFTTTDRYYTVTFEYMDELGETIEEVVDNLKYGDEINLADHRPGDGFRDEAYTYYILGWRRNGEERIELDAVYTVDGDAALSADYNKVSWFTISAFGENGTIEGVGMYDEGTEIQLIATGNSGYAFEAWEDGETANPRIITVTADATYTAIFTAVAYTITKNVEGEGMILGPDGANLDDVVTLTAEPAEGWNFKSWEDGSEDAERQITIIGDVEVTATFEIQTFTITFIVGPITYPIENVPYGMEMAELFAEIDGVLEQFGVIKNEQGQYLYYDGKDWYRFTGWDKEIPDNVSGEATYTANFELVPSTPTGLEAVEMSGKVLKVYENGVMYIIRNGKKYTIYGSLVQ